MSRAMSWGRRTLVGMLLLAGMAPAAPDEVHLLPTQVQTHGAPVNLKRAAQQLDELLAEAVRDFELRAIISEPATSDPGALSEVALQMGRHSAVPTERDLVQLADNAWVVAPQLLIDDGGLWVRIVAVAPGSETLWIRSDFIGGGQMAVRTLGLLRELLANQRGPSASTMSPASADEVARSRGNRSAGRAVLALHAVALGGYLGVALQRASGSTDLRLAYPLATLGAGVGLASAMVVAEEWNITPATAWYLSASAVWPTVGTLLLLQAEPNTRREDRHLFGLLSAAGGLTLATAGLSLGTVDYGGAALTHSGALFGLLLGGLTQRLLAGDAAGPLTTGMGVGAVAGVAVSGVIASQIDVSSASDFLFVDLSAVLGGLAAAALGTPFLVSDQSSKLRDRLWLGGVVLGTVAGGAIGYSVLGQGESLAVEIKPMLGAVGQQGWGMGLSGSW